MGAASLALRPNALTEALKNGTRPNVVYILCDDLGWGDIDVYDSHSAIPTPRCNAFARQGMRFTDMHSASAFCTPSRYAILTGLHPWLSRLKKGVLWRDSPNLIEPERMTVASMLKEDGYYTAGVGKWHLGLGNAERATTASHCDLGLGPWLRLLFRHSRVDGYSALSLL